MPAKHTSKWLIDAVLFTGLVISSWLDLTLFKIESWLTIHILASIGTLILVTLKIVPHWSIDFCESA